MKHKDLERRRVEHDAWLKEEHGVHIVYHRVVETKDYSEGQFQSREEALDALDELIHSF